MKWNITESAKTERTEELLKNIAKHLSTNRKYRKTEFVITISRGTKTDTAVLQIFPFGMDIFPNTHKRKPADKTNVLKHVLSEHILDEKDASTLKYNPKEHEITIHNSELFIYGTYKYQLSYNGKQRRWVNIVY